MATPKLPIPRAALESHVGVLGKTGSGKSNLAKLVVEWLLAKRQRVCVVDPTGTWWGLRSSAAGDAPGFPIVVFGGAHGDLPVSGAHGATIGEAIATASTPAVIDLRAMAVGERTRFFIGFAETVLARNAGPLTLVIDEAHLFMPQQNIAGGRDVPRNQMLHAGNNLVSLGRAAGLRIVLISQRASKLHKDSLTQVETLVVFRMLAPQDRNAVMDWIGEWADPGEGRKIVAELPSLKTGTGWVWAPEIGLLEKKAFPLAGSLDTGAAGGALAKGGKAPVLAPIDLAAMQQSLATIAEEAKANDPRALKGRIAELERDLKAAHKSAPAAHKNASSRIEMPEAAIAAAREEGRQAGLDAGYDLGFARGMVEGGSEAFLMIEETMPDAVRRAFKGIAETYGAEARRQLDGAEKRAKAPSRQAVNRIPDKTVPGRPAAAIPHPAAPNAAAQPDPVPDGALAAPLQKIVDAVAWWRALGIDAPSYPQVAFRAGYSPRGGTFNRYLSELRSRGLIAGSRNRRVTLSGAGSVAAREPDAPPTGAELRATIIAEIHGPLAKLMAPLIEAWPEPLARDELGSRAGYEASGGTFNRYLSSLRSLELVATDRVGIAAQDWMFP